jgi:nitrogen-specific signal transduction histidine kinase/CheY-like chemotaxis protein
MGHEGKKIYVRDSAVGVSNPAVKQASTGAHLSNGGVERQFEEQLFQSQRLEGLGTLVGGIAHDFNNILNVITGHVSLMDRWRTNPERFEKSFEAVKKATERGAGMARQLLTFARKVEVVPEWVDIGDAIEEIVGLLRATFPEKVVFDVRIEPDMPAIPADSNQIHQALLNLCVNARDAMLKGGTISIAAEKIGRRELNDHFPEVVAEQYVMVRVSDTGSGMEDEILAHIFEPFFTTKGGRGTGLGLAVVYGIMKAHDGFIDVETKVGTGTAFSLYFPIVRRVVESVPEENGGAESPNGHGELILAIEDEEPLRDFLKSILEESGYKVLLASDGMRGLQTYRDHLNEISIVLLDMGLPEMSGTEVLAGLLLLNPRVKVISASGYLEPEVKADAYEIGALDFLAKPYLVEELLMKVHRALQVRA